MKRTQKAVCTDPPRHVHDEDELLREVGRVCNERGLRLTPLRADVLRLVARSDRPIKAYDLLSHIRASKATTAPPTAYRTLDFLIENGFVHKLESINAFVACHHPSTQHSVPFLICDDCQLTVEMEDERTAKALGESARDLGFTATSQNLEVHGLCKHCRRGRRATPHIRA